MNQVQYFAPLSLAEALSLLSEHGEKCKIVAGGTDLLPQMNKKALLPNVIINIKTISDLDYVDYDQANGLTIGGLTSISSIAKSPLIRDKYNVLSQAANVMATPVIRDQATIGGNLCNAAPSADTAPALIVLGARVKIIGKDSEGVVAVEDFFTGPGQTILKHGQIVAEIQIPTPPPQSGAAYIKHSRVKGADLAVVGVAALVSVRGETFKEVKIALGAVAPTPIRARDAEGILKGKQIAEKLLEEAGEAARCESSCINDVRGSADYRQKLVSILVKRAVRQAFEQAKSEV